MVGQARDGVKQDVIVTSFADGWLAGYALTAPGTLMEIFIAEDGGCASAGAVGIRSRGDTMMRAVTIAVVGAVHRVEGSGRWPRPRPESCSCSISLTSRDAVLYES